jgi:hypothetical protein
MEPANHMKELSGKQKEAGWNLFVQASGASRGL